MKKLITLRALVLMKKRNSFILSITLILPGVFNPGPKRFHRRERRGLRERIFISTLCTLLSLQVPRISFFRTVLTFG